MSTEKEWLPCTRPNCKGQIDPESGRCTNTYTDLNLPAQIQLLNNLEVKRAAGTIMGYAMHKTYCMLAQRHSYGRGCTCGLVKAIEALSKAIDA